MMGVIHDGYGKAIDENNPLHVETTTVDVLPTEIQSRYATTIQTHTNQVVPNGTGVNTAWIDTDGFSDISVSLLNSLATATSGNFDWSNDGVNVHRSEQIASQTAYTNGALVETKARYVKIFWWNGHTAPVTINSFVYLKA